MTAPKPAVLVVLPTYEEAATVEAVLRRIRDAAPDVAVLVVDDASPDGTSAIARRVGDEVGNVDVLDRPGKAGLGTAYRDGFAWGRARGFDVLVEMDADLSHDPLDLPRLLAAVDDGADLAIGSRYVPGGAMPDWPLPRRLLSRYGNRYAQWMLGLRVRDATAGFRAYRGMVLDKVDLDHVRSDGYGFQIELAYRVRKLGCEIVEIPITFHDRADGVSKMSPRIVVEAMILVTGWGIRDRLRRLLAAARRRRQSRS